MRKSLWGRSRMGRGGGEGSGRGMCRAAAKSVSRAGFNVLNQQDPPASSATDPPTTTNRHRRGLSISPASATAKTPTSPLPSSLSISKSAPVSPAASHQVDPFGSWDHKSSSKEEIEWEYLDKAADGERRGRGGSEAAEDGGLHNEVVFGMSPPPPQEVENALLSLQRGACRPALFQGRITSEPDEEVPDDFSPAASARIASATPSEVDWMEPPSQLLDRRLDQPDDIGNMYYAMHLLRTEPSFQRMVVALASDGAVWDAILNNKVVRELKESLDEAEGNGLKSPNIGRSPDSIGVHDGKPRATLMLAVIVLFVVGVAGVYLSYNNDYAQFVPT